MQYNKITKTLIISYDFDEELKDIPNDTEIIIFENENKDSRFNQKVDNLPENLTHLTFGTEFNQKVDNLPQNLIHLTFRMYFNQKVDKLSKNLTHLILNDLFLKKINNLPKNLTHLTFRCWINEKLCNLPKNLTYIKIKGDFNNIIILPKSLKKLSLTCNNNLINNIPKHIETVYIWFYKYDNKYGDEYNKKIDNLPLTIKKIVIKYEKFKKYIKVPFGCILTIKNKVLLI
jgi:hypothetical protein